MATTAAQQIALDNDLVALEKQVEIGKCNMRIDPEKTQKEPHLSSCFGRSCSYYMLSSFSYHCKCSIFREILQICLRLTYQEFDEPPFEAEILSFIKELGHIGNIKNITTVVIDHMHQPWRTFALIINKCLSGKITGLGTIRLSRAQILWGMYYKRNIDYVALLWEDIAFRIDNKDVKKLEKINDYSKDTRLSSLSDLSCIRYWSCNSNPKRIYKKHDSPMIKTTTTSPKETPSKKKSAPAKKDVFLKNPLRKQSTAVQIRDTPGVSVSKKKALATIDKRKCIDLPSEAALLEDTQMEKVLKQSKRKTHSLQPSGSGDGVGSQPKVSDEPK
ncbi:hypothetical protein Tco_1249142, partial [Tanacetum coccineum]